MWVVFSFGDDRHFAKIDHAQLDATAPEGVRLHLGADSWDFEYADAKRASVVHAEFLAAVLRGERVFYMPGE